MSWIVRCQHYPDMTPIYLRTWDPQAWESDPAAARKFSTSQDASAMRFIILNTWRDDGYDTKDEELAVVEANDIGNETLL